MSAFPAVPHTGRLAFLDGIRALAALWVMLGHLRLFALGWHAAPLWALPLNFLLYLHYGVVVFLVLSGFCLALPVVHAGDRFRNGLAPFFLARALRILPPYLAVLALILLANTFVPVVQWGRHDLGLTGTMSWQVFWTNALLLQDIYPQYNRVNGPFWSVACEFHLYLVFPLLIWWLRRLGIAVMLGASVLLAAGLTILSDHVGMGDGAAVPQPPYYVALLALGIAAAALTHSPRLASARTAIFRGAPIVALAGAVALAALFWQYPIQDIDSVLRHNAIQRYADPLAGLVASAVLVSLCGLAPAHRLRRLLEHPLLVSIGGFSYSLYLTHIPLLAIMYRGVQRLHRPPEQTFLLLFAVGVPVCIGFAWGFGKLFERPIRWRPASWQAASTGNRPTA